MNTGQNQGGRLTQRQRGRGMGSVFELCSKQNRRMPGIQLMRLLIVFMFKVGNVMNMSVIQAILAIHWARLNW